MFFKKGFLEISKYLLENICVGVSFAGLLQHAFSCEYCEIF